MRTRNEKGQGALEYLLILGAAIVVVAIVIFMVMSAATTAPTDEANTSIEDSFDQLRNLVPSNGGGSGGGDLSCTTTADCTTGSCGDLTCQVWPGVGSSAPQTINLPDRTVQGQVFGGAYTNVFSDYGNYKTYYSGGGESIDFYVSGTVGMTTVTANNQWVLYSGGYYIISAVANEASGPFEVNWSSAVVTDDMSGSYPNINYTGFANGSWSAS